MTQSSIIRTDCIIRTIEGVYLRGQGRIYPAYLFLSPSFAYVWKGLWQDEQLVTQIRNILIDNKILEILTFPITSNREVITELCDFDRIE